MHLLEFFIRGHQSSHHQGRLLLNALLLLFKTYLACLSLRLLFFFYQQPELLDSILTIAIDKLFAFFEIEHKVSFFNKELIELFFDTVLQAHYLALSSSLLVLLYFLYQGSLFAQKKYERGTQLLSLKDYKHYYKQAPVALELHGLPLVQEALRRHFLFLGTTGTGKTLLIRELLLKMKAYHAKLLCLDIDNSFKELAYEGQHINLTDSLAWDFFEDCQNEFDFEAVAAVLIPASNGDIFWVKAARLLFVTLCHQLQQSVEYPSLQHLYELVCQTHPIVLKEKIKNTPAASLCSGGTGDRFFASIVGTMSTYCSVLRYCTQGKHKISIKDWMLSKAPLVFHCAQANLEAYKPLLTLWFELFIRAILSSGEQSGWTPCYIFAFDELGSLNEIPSLPLLASRGRKYGVCILAGLQDIHQMNLLYKEQAETLLSNLSTKFFLCQGSQKNAQWAADIIGSFEEQKHHSSSSFGLSEHRNTISFNEYDKRDFVLTPTDLLTLPTRTVIVRQLHYHPIKIEF